MKGLAMHHYTLEFWSGAVVSFYDTPQTAAERIKASYGRLERASVLIDNYQADYPHKRIWKAIVLEDGLKDFFG